MKKVGLFLILSFLFAGCSFDKVQMEQAQKNSSQAVVKTGTGSAPDERQASRDPFEGCAWKDFDASGLHLKLKVQDCSGLNGEALRVHENSIVLFSRNPAYQQEMQKVIEVFQKETNASPEAALQQQFISKLDVSEREKCIVEKETSTGLDSGQYYQKPDQSIYRIRPTDEYAQELSSKVS